MAPRPCSGQRSPHYPGTLGDPLELFIDLAYAFAATQVTDYMTHEHSLHAVIAGLLLLALL